MLAAPQADSAAEACLVGGDLVDHRDLAADLVPAGLDAIASVVPVLGIAAEKISPAASAMVRRFSSAQPPSNAVGEKAGCLVIVTSLDKEGVFRRAQMRA